MPATLTHAGGIRLCDALPECQISGPREMRVASCCSDPGGCRPGDLFVALCADEFDGHEFAHEAIDRGAAAVLAERMLPVPAPLCLVPDTREAYGRICQALVDHPTREMTTIGVTGTHGKTTVAKLLAGVLRTAGGRVGAINSLECCDGFVSFDGHRPSSPPELAHWTAEMQAAGCTHCIVELDGRDLAQRRAAGLELNAAIVTNLRREKAHPHGTLKNYRLASSRIFDQLKAGGFAVLSAEDRGSRRILAELDHPAMTVDRHGDAEVSATLIERHRSEQTALLSAGSDTIPLRTRMIGEQHLSNCMLAAATALALGVDLPTIVRGLEAVESVPLRMERIECGQPFSVFVDVADSPDRLAACLKTVRRVARGRVICVANADGPLDERPLIGRVLEKHAGLGLITTAGCSEYALHAIHDVIDGYHRPAQAHAIPDRRQAIGWALAQAQEGDCVLIAGCRDRHPLRGGGQPVDDAEFVRRWMFNQSRDVLDQMILRMPGE